MELQIILTPKARSTTGEKKDSVEAHPSAPEGGRDF